MLASLVYTTHPAQIHPSIPLTLPAAIELPLYSRPVVQVLLAGTTSYERPPHACIALSSPLTPSLRFQQVDMAADDSLMVTLLGNLGLFGACVLFLSPIPTVSPREHTTTPHI
jgi:hypothetical protein